MIHMMNETKYYKPYEKGKTGQQISQNDTS